MDGLSYGGVESFLEMKQIPFMELGIDSIDVVKLVEDLNAKHSPRCLR